MIKENTLELMMKTHIAQILQTKIDQNSHLTVAEKDELLSLARAIDNNFQQLAKTHSQAAHEIEHIAETTETGEHTDIMNAVKEISAKIEKFEVTHPELVDLVNRLCIMLANLGI